MKSILILFAHPVAEKSRVQRSLLSKAASLPNVSIRDLYQLYPDFNIDIEAEKDALSQHDIVLWQHPFYWYSSPALLKQWIDLVLEYGWAYTVTRAAQNFIKYDETDLVMLSKQRGDQKGYMASARRQIEIQEDLLRKDRDIMLTSEDHAWDSEPMVRNANR